MQFTIYNANITEAPQNTQYPYEAPITDLQAFERAMKRDHVCAKYKNDCRGIESFLHSDCIPMDCDNNHSDDPAAWKTPEDVRLAFPNIAFAVCYSRHHMKIKKGKAARPKFHVYFPIQRIDNVNQYVELKKQIWRRFPEFDENALDGGRFLFGVASPQVMMFEGQATVDTLFILAGGRNATLLSKACKLIKRHGNTGVARVQFDAEARKCVPPLDDRELESIWQNAVKYGARMAADDGYIPPEQFAAPQECLQKLKPEENRLYPWTELGAGQLFADYYQDIVRYVPERKSWYYYADGIWQQDIGSLCTMEYCKELAKQLMIYCVSIADDNRRQEYMKFCARWQTRKMRDTILKDAQGVHKIAMEEFDSDPYVFNCQNGTLHLDTMQFTPHRASDKLTKISNVVYDPEARCERFEKFVDEIMCSDQEKARFLQKALGYGITGDTRYECFFIFYGATTRNGKGTLCESVLKVLGSYGCTARAETIGIKQNTSSQMPSEDIARLAGVRFVNISEPDRSLRLDAALVKSMTGNDTMNARFLHENSFDFKPQFKMYINTNYRPAINDLTLFSSGRVIIITFDRHFGEGEQDTNLKVLFSRPNSQSAILNWLVEGYAMLCKEGLKLPQTVKAAIEEYHKDSDKIRCFVDECLEADNNAEVRTAAVYKEYQQWCEDNGYRAESSKKFKESLGGLAEVVRKRPKGGGSETTILLKYKLANAANPL